MGPIPLKAMGSIEPAGFFIFPKDKDKCILKAKFFQPTEGLLKKQAALSLAPLGRVGIEGGNLSPIGISIVVKGAGVPEVVIFLAGPAIIDGGHRGISTVEKKSVDPILLLIIFLENGDPPIVGDLTVQIVLGHIPYVGIPPAQSVDQTIARKCSSEVAFTK